MRKIIIIVYSFLITALIITTILGSMKNADIKFFTLPENYSYVYKSDKYITLNIYSKSDEPLIMYPEVNSYQIKLDNISYQIEDVKTDGYKKNNYYLVKLNLKLPKFDKEEFNSDSFNLIIRNGSYELELFMGTLSILNPINYKKGVINHLEGSYSKLFNYLDLVGLNIEFGSNGNFLKNFKIGYYNQGYLSKAIFDKYYDNEININDLNNYDPKKNELNNPIGMKSNKMFIPISNKNEYLVRNSYLTYQIDDELYYFSEFSFMITDPDFNSYKNKMKEGNLKNA